MKYIAFKELGVFREAYHDFHHIFHIMINNDLVSSSDLLVKQSEIYKLWPTELSQVQNSKRLKI